MAQTRHQTEIWLLGQPVEHLSQNVLPMTIDILRTFYYQREVLNKGFIESRTSTVDCLLEIWKKASIPTKEKRSILVMFDSVYEKYNGLKKNRTRANEKDKAHQDALLNNINRIFDIAHKNAENLMVIEEDIIFLRDQRGNRKMKMDKIDQEFQAQQQRKEERKQIEIRRKQQEKERLEMEQLQATFSASSISEVSAESEYGSYELEIPAYYKNNKEELSAKKPRIIENILNSPDVSSALDRINLSNGKFTMLLAAIARGNGENLENTPLSLATVRRKRAAHRSTICENVKEDFAYRFFTASECPLVVHWDGKIMKNTTKEANNVITATNTDRLAVVVTGHKIEKVLGISKLMSGEGEAQANATYQLLQLWNIADFVVGMSFDTTSSNTGVVKGSCSLLEKRLGRNLLHLACRHHIYEIIVAALFDNLFGPSSGPNIPLFQKFQKAWPTVNKIDFTALEDVRLEEEKWKNLREETVNFCKEALMTKEGYMPRNDYRELMELCLMIFGEWVLPNGNDFTIRSPGACHRARWMAKLIYCFKIYLFRKQLQLTTSEEKNLKEFCLFSALIYVKAWISCPIPSDAPVNDLAFYRRLHEYAEINEKISTIAIKKFQNHLWYLGPEIIPLALFSSKLPQEEKESLVQQLKSYPEDWSIRKIRRKDHAGLEKKWLEELVDSSSVPALRSLGFNIDFIFNREVTDWNSCPEYEEAINIIKSLKVVNDAAERSIALMSCFNTSITTSETEMQKVLQVVEDHRKRVPNKPTKNILSSYNRR